MQEVHDAMYSPINPGRWKQPSPTKILFYSLCSSAQYIPSTKHKSKSLEAKGEKIMTPQLYPRFNSVSLYLYQPTSLTKCNSAAVAKLFLPLASAYEFPLRQETCTVSVIISRSLFTNLVFNKVLCRIVDWQDKCTTYMYLFPLYIRKY